MSLLEKHYTQEHQIFRESIRRYFEREVTPRVEEWEKAGIVPKTVWRDFGSQGFLCPWLPEAYGGVGADLLYSLISMEERRKDPQLGLPLPPALRHHRALPGGLRV